MHKKRVPYLEGAKSTNSLTELYQHTDSPMSHTRLKPKAKNPPERMICKDFMFLIQQGHRTKVWKSFPILRAQVARKERATA